MKVPVTGGAGYLGSHLVDAKRVVDDPGWSGGLLAAQSSGVLRCSRAQVGRVSAHQWSCGSLLRRGRWITVVSAPLDVTGTTRACPVRDSF